MELFRSISDEEVEYQRRHDVVFRRVQLGDGPTGKGHRLSHR